MRTHKLLFLDSYNSLVLGAAGVFLQAHLCGTTVALSDWWDPSACPLCGAWGTG